MLSAALALALLASPEGTQTAPVTQTWGVGSSTAQIGTLKVVTRGAEAEVDFRIDNNGRGAKLTEKLRFDAAGRLIRREIEGKGEAGAPVKESFWIENGKAKWSSLDDHGEADAAGGFYFDRGGSPWTMVELVRELRAAKDHTVALLPSGRARLEVLHDVEVGKPGALEKVTAAAVFGVDLEPQVVLLRKDHLVGVVSGWRVLAEQKLMDDRAQLLALGQALSGEVMAGLARRLTHRLSEPLWLTHVRVFDSATGTLSPPRTVVVYRGVVTEVSGDEPPKGAKVADAAGGALLPGLFDSHAHMDPISGLLDIASGVTFGRDPGNNNASLLELEPRFDSGELIGPRLWKSGFLEGRSPYSAQLGIVVGSLDEALAGVRWYAEHGYWGLKIYNSMTPDWVKPIAAEAHRLGLHVSGHVPAFMSSERAIRDGYDEVNHINQLLLYLVLKPGEDTRTPFRFTSIGERAGTLDLSKPPFQKLLKLMKERHTTLDATMAIFGTLLLARPGKASPFETGWVDHVPPPVRRSRMTLALDIKPEQYPAYEAAWKKLEEVLVTLDRAGVPLVPGTDDYAGVMLHSELESWAASGLAPGHVLSLATLGGAKFLGQSANLGAIERGRRADLYLVDGDPTKDISVIRKGRLVMKGDALFYPDEIHEALGVTPFAPRLAVPGAQ